MEKNIVIVEDEENIARAEELILKDHFKDFNIHLAHDGEEGLDKIKETNPTLVILDIMLPKISGFDLCKKIKGDDKLKSTKIVMVTAKNQDKDEAEGMGIGADDYIMKPFEPVELLHVVNQVLKQ